MPTKKVVFFLHVPSMIELHVEAAGPSLRNSDDVRDRDGSWNLGGPGSVDRAGGVAGRP